jgi:hypothetical protein
MHQPVMARWLTREERDAAAKRYKEERTAMARAPGVQEIRKFTMRVFDRFAQGNSGEPGFKDISLADVGRGFMDWPSKPILLG